VLSGADEVVRFLEAIPSLKSRTALTTVYAAGLRVSDVSPCAIHPRSGRLALPRLRQGHYRNGLTASWLR
jgi:integrase/recombinase XerD